MVHNVKELDKNDPNYIRKLGDGYLRIIEEWNALNEIQADNDEKRLDSLVEEAEKAGVIVKVFPDEVTESRVGDNLVRKEVTRRVMLTSETTEQRDAMRSIDSKFRRKDSEAINEYIDIVTELSDHEFDYRRAILAEIKVEPLTETDYSKDIAIFYVVHKDKVVEVIYNPAKDREGPMEVRTMDMSPEKFNNEFRNIFKTEGVTVTANLYAVSHPIEWVRPVDSSAWAAANYCIERDKWLAAQEKEKPVESLIQRIKGYLKR
ncbi:hypothetical protein H6503_03815 [Candidatus Woesearchaeota archaeon]|nr:hypothetical protein [Candidatus Woesearchaeota archaeon]